MYVFSLIILTIAKLRKKNEKNILVINFYIDFSKKN